MIMEIMKKYESIFVVEETSIRTALQKLCSSKKQVLFVTDGPRLLASLNDGDIRRFLLAGGNIDAPVKDAANYHVHFLMDAERSRAKSYLWEHNINALPIVDDDKNILDVVFLHDSVEIDKVAIRQLGQGDIPMALEFFDQMAGDTRAMFNRGDVNRIRMIEHLSKRHNDHEIHFAAVVKETDGREKMVGYVFLWDTDTLIPWLGICVHEDWKGNHLGRKLLDFLDAHAQSNGYGGLMLTSVPANIRAHSLYERMGYEYFGAHPNGEFLYIKRYRAK